MDEYEFIGDIMLWYVCLIISILLMCRTIVVLIDKSSGKFTMGKVLVYMLSSAYIIYLPVFFSTYSFVGALIGDLMNTMQIISLDAGYLDYIDIVRRNIDFNFLYQIYIFVLGLTHFFIPIVSALTAYSFIVHWVSYLKLVLLNKQNRDVFVFSEVNERSVNLAIDISKNVKKKSDFIFISLTEKVKDYDYLLEKMNCFFLPDDISNIKLNIKNKSNVYFFNIAENENDNLNDTLQIIDRFSKEEKEIQKKIHIYMFSEKQDIDKMIDSTDKGLLNVRIIDFAQLSCYKLFDEYPLYKGMKNNTISLAILGMNSIGEEVLKSALWIGQLEGVKLKITVIDEGIDKKKSYLELVYPEIFSENYNINFYEAKINNKSIVDVLNKNCIDSTYIVICNGNDEDNIRTAILLRRFYYKCDNSFTNKPFVAVYIEDSEKFNMVKGLKTPELNPQRRVSYDITPFGGINSICSYDEIINSRLEKLAVNVHMTYENIFSDENSFDVNEALERYNVFEVNKKSNLANALHIRYKLWLLGLDYTDREDVEQVRLKDYFSDDYLDKLTYMEHDRWMAFLRTEGWTTASLEDVKKYKASDLSRGRHNCPIMQMHPYICDFERLKEVSDALGLPDATVYDKELITRIEDILSDKWNIAGKKYRIIKLKEREL